ncbi:MAG: hypothetical protein BAJALOKI1v1_1280009 [Promethearchaeota archaeon]|nr:MAG: hypothetical protein BAJALOKI1v1_1280009 [Candidatus Lokiarchaeota archaeon]
MTILRIRCPICKTEGEIEITRERLGAISRGVTAVNISSNTVCTHSFIVYIDKNLAIRDYFTVDFQIEIPEIPIRDQPLDLTLPNKDILNLDLIKLNLPASILFSILRAIFLKKRVILVQEDQFLKKHIINFFEIITKDSFEVAIEVLTENEYKKDKKKFKNSLVFQENELIKKYKEFIDPNKIKLEKQIINRFLEELDLKLSYIMLKNEISKAYMLSKAIVDYIKDQGGYLTLKTDNETKDSLLSNILDEVLDKEKYLSTFFADYLNEKFTIKIQKYYLNFLLEIVENYFEINLKKIIKI